MTTPLTDEELAELHHDYVRLYGEEHVVPRLIADLRASRAREKRLAALVQEFLTHDEHNFGRWTSGMRQRAREALNG